MGKAVTDEMLAAKKVTLPQLLGDATYEVKNVGGAGGALPVLCRCWVASG